MSAAQCRVNRRSTPSIQQRVEILNKLEEGASMSQLATGYGISTRSVQRIKRDAVQIRQLMEQERNSKRRRRCKSSCKNLDERLYTWFLERRALGDIITDLLLREKALEFVRELRGSSTFTASNGWLWRFKNRYGIRKLGVHGEGDDTNQSAADKFIQDLNRRLEEENIDGDYIYNMDETGLVWKTLPRKTLAQAYENRIDRRKMRKDRVTVGFCTNATGSHKLSPLFIYKCENPRALEHCKNTLPVVFKSQRDTRMDQEIFADWYNNHFKTSVREHQREKGAISKVLLLVNNSRGCIPSEENISDDRFEVLFLPANGTSILQPLDQGIIENTKRIYRYHMLKRILDFPDGVKEFYRYYNIRDCINMLHKSWMDVTSANIKNSWRRFLGKNLDMEEDTTTVTFATLQRLINDIMGENIAPAELTEWLASCAEAEEEEELQEQQENTGSTEENIESRPPDPDDEEIKRPFGSAWAKTQNDFVQFHIKVRPLASMKVEGGVATTTVLQKVKVKEETKECCGYQQASPSSTSAATTATVATLSVSAATAITTTVTNSNGVSTVVANPSTTTTVATAVPSAIICHPPTTNTADSLPVDLDLKAKNKASSAPREKSSREEAVQPEAHSPSSQHQRIGQQKQTNGSRSEYKGASGCSRSSDNDSPLPSQSVKPELEEGPGVVNAGPRTDEQSDGTALANGTGGASRCVSGIFAGHGKLKRLLGTLVQFATDISTDTGDTVRTLVLALLSGSMTAEEFHSALQEATNFPLRSFVLPYLKHTLPSLQRDLSNAARANNQSCVQFLRSNESAVLEAVGLVPSGESVEVFGEHGGANGIGGGNQCSAHYAMRSNSNPGVGAIQHAAGSNAAGALHHYPGAAHAPKRRASDTPYYENGTLLDDMPVYGKRSMNPWSHHHQQQQQQQQQPTDPSYCWYHPLHSSGGSIQGHAHGHGHGPSPVPPSLVQINQINAFSAPHHLTQQPQQPIGHGLQTQNGGSLDDEWKNIHVMLNCILGMVEKTKRALAILQRRGCSSPAAAAPPPGVVAAQNGTSNNGNSNGNNPSSTNGVQVESSTGDRDGNLKRLSGEIVAQTIRATEDRVAEVKRRAEEAVLEVKRAAVAEVQRAVAVAVAESRANERLRVHRLLDLPLSQRNHANIRQGPFLRVHGSSSTVETSARNVTTPTTTPSSAPSTTEDEKDVHLTGVMGSSCWNCGRPALETCGGCGIARYCGSFCQHRDWEAGHHTTCNNLPPRESRRSASRSPPRVTATNLSTSVNEVDAAPVASAGVSKGK